MTLPPPPLLDADGLAITVGPRTGRVTVVRDATLRIDPGEIVGLVGESGSGKTMVARAIVGLLPDGAEWKGRRLLLAGHDLLVAPMSGQQRRGTAAVVFQDPMSALNPYLRVGTQLREAVHPDDAPNANDAMVRALADVGIAEPTERLRSYPHELSGGMRQRVMIAMALLSKPRLLVADEPTTALDVTVQAQVLKLLGDLNRTRGMAILLISHDLGVVAQVASRVAVMYAGEVVEVGEVRSLFAAPAHPYTRALLASRPANQARGARLRVIEGTVPAPTAWPSGCAFHPRCPKAEPLCRTGQPRLQPAPHGGSTRCLIEAVPKATSTSRSVS